MTYVNPRPWWKFWPVFCRRHWRRVPKDSICPKCAEEGRTRRVEVFLENLDKIRTIREQTRV